jgi:hypothetical protein
MPYVYAMMLLLVMAGCSRPTFYQKTYSFNRSIATNHFDEAERMIQENKDLEESKVRFLYWVNAGVVEHLRGEFERSNEYFTRADLFIEDERKNALEEGAAFLLNPNISTYFGEDHEVLMIHYYKALNYYILGDLDDALVEVRRLNLRLNQLSEKYKSEDKYTRDAFMHLLMGIIYEANADMNNAFIAYRNAYEIYKDDFARFFNLAAPAQLKKDLIRTAALSGLSEEKRRYEQEFGIEYQSDGAEAHVVVLWNNGMGPIKEEWGINFAIIQDSFGWVTFVNKEFGFTFPFYVGDRQFDVTWIKVVFPRYVARTPLFSDAVAIYAGQQYPLELGEDLNKVSFKVLNERMLYEFSTSLIRAALKQVAAHQIGESSDSPGLGAVLSIMASATESADTRNWQTLPHSIYYTRVPVNSGDQEVRFQMSGNISDEKILKINNIQKGELVIYPFYSLGTGEP